MREVYSRLIKIIYGILERRIVNKIFSYYARIYDTSSGTKEYANIRVYNIHIESNLYT